MKLGAIASLLIAGFTRLISGPAAFFLALKGLLIAFFTILLPVVLNNFFAGYVEKALDKLDSISIVSQFGGVAHLTGVLGWICSTMQIPAIVSLLVSALQVHLILKIIPFSPVK